MKSPKKQVLKAIQKLGNNVTVADVVARSGCSLQDSALLLNEIAAETSATLHVNVSGDILYRFQPNFQFAYFSKGAAKVFGNIVKTIGPFVFFLFKISFGLTLMLSVIVIFGIVLILRSLMSVGMDSGESVSGMWLEFLGALRRIVWLDFRHIKKLKKLSPGDDAGAASPQVSTSLAEVQDEIPPTQGFLLDCYYFLFGPGNPNEGIEETRWKLMAQAIRLNEGVVLAEHLVPYTGRPPDDEHTLFSILSKFNGRPVVSESGDILYTFPSIAVRSEIENYAFTPPLVLQREWQFTGLSGQALKPVILLAVANVMGAFLFFMIIAMIGGRHRADLSLFAFFSIYGFLFLAIPAVRWFTVRANNKKIRQSNSIASEYERRIGKPDSQLLKRLEDAEQIRRSESVIDSKQIVYRTDEGYLEQMSADMQTKTNT